MILDLHTGIEKALENTQEVAIREAIEPLRSVLIDEMKVRPVMETLLKEWRKRVNAITLKTPLFFLEGVRLVAAMDEIRNIPDPDVQKALSLLSPPFLVDRDSLLLDGLQGVSEGLLREAIVLLQDATRKQPPVAGVAKVQEAIQLITAVADDCVGPLGAVYRP
jgi:hypothetical protein